MNEFILQFTVALILFLGSSVISHPLDLNFDVFIPPSDNEIQNYVSAFENTEFPLKSEELRFAKRHHKFYNNIDNNTRILPSDLKPFYYQIKIHPYFDAPNVIYNKSDDQTFDGEVKIYFRVKNPTQMIVLNADLEILAFPDFESFEVYSITKGEIISIDMKEDSIENETITLLMERELNQNEYLTLKIPYKGKIANNSNYGFYKSSAYNKETKENDIVYATQFESTGARAAFPCFDEPEYKAVFQIEITKPKSWVALSNAMDISTVDVGNGYESVTFDKSPLMSTYLVAFGIGDLVSLEGPNTEVPITRVWTFRSGQDKLKAALDSARRCTKAMTDYTDFKLNLKKIDHLAIPLKTGAMENFGLIIYSKGTMLFKSHDDINEIWKPKNLESWYYITNVICHELSHHWFGDTVTNEWWGDIWLHEGFADYFENIAMALAYPNEKEYMNYRFATDNSFTSTYDIPGSHPIITENGKFDFITYQKGGAAIRQLAAVISFDTLRKGLQIYLKKYQYSNANYKQLLRSIQIAVDSDPRNLKDWCGDNFSVLNFMDLWLTQADHPILVINYSNGEYFVSQKLMNNSKHFWPLPIFTQGLNGKKRMYWSAPNYTCSNGLTLPQTLKIKAPVLLFNRDELAITELWYSSSAIQSIADAMISFSNDFQLSGASISTFIKDILMNAKRNGTPKEHFQSIIQNILVHQKNAFSYGIFDDITKMMETELENGKFDNVLARIGSAL